jgi:hypothetical protein
MQDQTLERLARFGYAARGVVYVLVGGLALLAAFGDGGRAAGPRGGLQTLLSQPYGAVWLGLIGLGLISFASWRLLQAIIDADHLGREWQAVVRRIGFGLSALVYAGLAITALAWACGIAAPFGDGESSAKGWTAYVLSAPLGQWLVGACGVGVAGFGIALFIKAWTARVEEHLALDRRARSWILPLGRIGFLARGLVFVVVGAFLVYAAIYSDPHEARGFAGALKALQSQSYGWALLAATALGLFAFGLFQFAVAYYRRIDASEVRATTRSMKRKAHESIQLGTN